MTITINLPIFPLRREIAALRKRLARGGPDAPPPGGRDAARRATRYSLEAFEFDIAGMVHLPQGPRSAR